MITVEALTKTYGGFTAVDDVTFTAQPGRVTGFLGPQRRRQVHHHADHGRPHPRHVRRRPPSSAAASPTCPTRALRSACCSTPPPSTPAAPAARSSPWPSAPWGCRKTRVDEMLDLVSLTDDGGRPPGARLLPRHAPAARHRHRPASATREVLILDEPANGLDPAGIRWMRDLLRGYADRGGTVLLSSPPAPRDRGHRRRHRRDRQRPDRRPGHQGRAARTPPAPSSAPRDPARARARPWPRPGHRGRRSAGGPAHRRRPRRRSARSPSAAGIALTELRAADGAGLEEMFLELTADTQRDDTRSSSMSTATIHDATSDRRRPRTPRAARADVTPASRCTRSWSASSCARCSTPAPASG